jgi:hypothetical protein
VIPHFVTNYCFIGLFVWLSTNYHWPLAVGLKFSRCF